MTSLFSDAGKFTEVLARASSSSDAASNSGRPPSGLSTANGGGSRARTSRPPAARTPPPAPSRGGGEAAPAWVRLEDVLRTTAAAEAALRSNVPLPVPSETPRARDSTSEALQAAHQRTEAAVAEASGERAEREQLTTSNARLSAELRAAQGEVQRLQAALLAAQQAARRAASAPDAEAEEVETTISNLLEMLGSERHLRSEMEAELSAQHARCEQAVFERRADARRAAEAVAAARGSASVSSAVEREAAALRAQLDAQRRKVEEASGIISDLRLALQSSLSSGPSGTPTGSSPGRPTRNDAPLFGAAAAAAPQALSAGTAVALEAAAQALDARVDVVLAAALQSAGAQPHASTSALFAALAPALRSTLHEAVTETVAGMRIEVPGGGHLWAQGFPFAAAEGSPGASPASQHSLGASPGGVPGKHKFVLWLAAERRKREEAERRLDDVTEELARSEHSRREATHRWLEVASQLSTVAQGGCGGGNAPGVAAAASATAALAQAHAPAEEAEQLARHRQGSPVGSTDSGAQRQRLRASPAALGGAAQPPLGFLSAILAALSILPALLASLYAGQAPLVAAHAAAGRLVAQGRLHAHHQPGVGLAALACALMPPLWALSWALLGEEAGGGGGAGRGAAAAGDLVLGALSFIARALRWLISL